MAEGGQILRGTAGGTWYKGPQNLNRRNWVLVDTGKNLGIAYIDEKGTEYQRISDKLKEGTLFNPKTGVPYGTEFASVLAPQLTDENDKIINVVLLGAFPKDNGKYGEYVPFGTGGELFNGNAEQSAFWQQQYTDKGGSGFVNNLLEQAKNPVTSTPEQTGPTVQETPSQEFIDYAKEMEELGVLDPDVKKIICASYPDLCAELNSTVKIPFNKQTPEQLLKSLREQQRQKNIKDGKIAATCPALSDTTGKTILLADPCKDNFFAKVEAHLTNFFDKITKLGSKIVNFPQELKTVVGQIGRAASTFIGTMVAKLTKAINKWISNALAGLTQQIFNTVSAPAQALLKIVGIEQDLLNPVKALNKALACLATKITQALTSVIEDLIMGMVRNVLNVPTCAVQQFIGALTTKIINLIDSAITPLLGPITKILGAVFKVKDFLVGAVKTIRKVLSFLKCGEKEKCPPSRKYIIDRGVKKDKGEKEQEDLLDKINNFSLTETVGQGISNFEKEYGTWDIFGSGPGAGDEGIGGSNCNTGNVFACGAPKVSFFGGDGIGGAGKVILGKFMREFDTDNIGGDIKRTASIIGVELTDPGAEYKDAPFVSFDDNCDQGYGAYGKAVIDTNVNSPTYGQITSVIIMSEGENYPAGDEEDAYIRDVVVEDPGDNYGDGDDLENDDLEMDVSGGRITAVRIKNPIRYTDLPKLNIRTETGYGAVLRPIMTTVRPLQTEIVTSIDCVT